MPNIVNLKFPRRILLFHLPMTIFDSMVQALDWMVSPKLLVEIGDSQLAGHFSEKGFSKQPFFRNGVPAIVAYPANRRSPSCYMR